jgi:hypothetical protein
MMDLSFDHCGFGGEVRHVLLQMSKTIRKVFVNQLHAVFDLLHGGFDACRC